MNEKICDLLSLDLWDTVIRRKCHPDAIKEKTSEYLLNNFWQFVLDKYRDVYKLTQKRVECEKYLGQKLQKQGFDDEYKINDVFALWISEVMPDYDKNGEIVKKIYDFELKTEIKNTYLDSTIVETVEKFRYRRLAYISDFYAGTSFVDEVLKAIKCPLHFDYKFVSCECGYNKRSGRLFQYVLDELHIESNQQVHLGDNEYSDVTIPRKKGIVCFQYLPNIENEQRLEREREYFENKKLDAINISKLHAAGKISMFFNGFISWIFESCKDEGIEEIYFFTREGEFYKKLYDEAVQYYAFKDTAPKSHILEVSRLATFFPSLREISINEMMRLWNQYSVQSMEAFLKSLDIEKEVIVPYISRYDIELEEVLEYPWLDQRILRLFSDKEFIHKMEDLRDQKKFLILQYLSQAGLDINNGRKIAIVDIGWRGTIQDNLCYLLSNYEIKGFYIGLIPFLNPQPKNAIKVGYINGYFNFNLLLKYVMPFEMICNSPNGSTSRYVKTETGEVIAERKKEQLEDKVYFDYIEKLQEQIVEDMKVLNKDGLSFKKYSSVFRESAYSVLNQFIIYPKHFVTKAYFSLKHNEEFGVGQFVDKSTRLRLGLFFKAVFLKRGRRELVDYLNKTTWPQGYLVYYHMKLLVKIYNKIVSLKL